MTQAQKTEIKTFEETEKYQHLFHLIRQNWEMFLALSKIIPTESLHYETLWKLSYPKNTDWYGVAQGCRVLLMEHFIEQLSERTLTEWMHCCEDYPSKMARSILYKRAHKLPIYPHKDKVMDLERVLIWFN